MLCIFLRFGIENITCMSRKRKRRKGISKISEHEVNENYSRHVSFKKAETFQKSAESLQKIYTKSSTKATSMVRIYSTMWGIQCGDWFKKYSRGEILYHKHKLKIGRLDEDGSGDNERVRGTEREEKEKETSNNISEVKV